MIAAAITTTRTAGSVTCPSLAATPARRATVSPGSTNPTKRASSAATSRPATTSTVQPGNPRRRSTTALTVRGPRTTATAGRRSRAMPAKGRHGDGRGDPSPGRTRSGAGVLGADRRRRELDEVLGLRGGGTGADERLDQLLVAHSAVERRAGVPRHRQLLLVRRGRGHPGPGHHVQEHRVRGLSRGDLDGLRDGLRGGGRRHGRTRGRGCSLARGRRYGGGGRRRRGCRGRPGRPRGARGALAGARR